MSAHVRQLDVDGFCVECQQAAAECTGRQSQNGRIAEPEQIRPVSDYRRGLSWQPVDLTAALDGGNTAAAPVLLERDDGAFLFYNGRFTPSAASQSR
ncbi:MAG: hypothetical protein WBH47_14015 [Streptosporangiaceae bacterium]